MGFFKIAPFLIPSERRLQTLAVLIHSTMFIFGLLIGLIVSFAMFYYMSRLFYLPVLYFAWRFYDRNRCNQGGWSWPSIRKWSLWRHYKNYFPLSLVKTADLSPDKNYIIGSHPHGVTCCGTFGHFCTDATGFSSLFPGITSHFLTLEGNFSSPLQREFLLASGMCSVSAPSISWLLTKEGTGKAIVIAIGGQAESLEAHPNSKRARLILKKRKGFVRLALKHGASLVPSFTFGENEIYSQLPNPEGSTLRKFQEKFCKLLGFAPAVFWGRGIFPFTFGFMPYRKPLITVVGKPIDVGEAKSCPTPEEIDKLHEKYVQGLKELFEEHKHKYGYSDVQLEI